MGHEVGTETTHLLSAHRSPLFFRPSVLLRCVCLPSTVVSVHLFGGWRRIEFIIKPPAVMEPVQSPPWPWAHDAKVHQLALDARILLPGDFGKVEHDPADTLTTRDFFRRMFTQARCLPRQPSPSSFGQRNFTTIPCGWACGPPGPPRVPAGLPRPPGLAYGMVVNVCRPRGPQDLPPYHPGGPGGTVGPPGTQGDPRGPQAQPNGMVVKFPWRAISDQF